MAKSKYQPAPQFQARIDYDLDMPTDKKVVEIFEKDLLKYFGQEEWHFGHRLTGFELLCYRNNFITYSSRYPDGAMVERNLPDYHEALMKFQGYGKLLDRRKEKKKIDDESIDALIENK
jgi:hypothetical protein